MTTTLAIYITIGADAAQASSPPVTQTDHPLVTPSAISFAAQTARLRGQVLTNARSDLEGLHRSVDRIFDRENLDPFSKGKLERLHYEIDSFAKRRLAL